MKELPEKKVLAQLEEAYARATVARVAWCRYGNWLSQIWCRRGVHVNNPAAEVFLKDGSLNDGADDEAFLLSLRRSNPAR